MTTKPRKKPVSRDKATLHAQIRALIKERDALKAALTLIASYDDKTAWSQVKLHNNYTFFDEPGSVQIAHFALTDANRKALANAGEQQ